MLRGFDRHLSERLPLPLARLYLRACNAQEDEQSRELHDSLLVLFEATVTLAAAVQIAVYKASDSHDPQLHESLGNLSRPTLGHWIGWLRDVSAYTAELTPHPFPPVASVAQMLRQKRKDLPAVRMLLVTLGEREEGMKRYSRDAQSIQLLDLLHALGAYRNKQPLTHGGGRRDDAFYDEIGEKLFAAAVEVLTQVPLFGEATLTYVKEKRDTRAQGSTAQVWTLMGTDAVRARESIATLDPTGTTVRPGRLYLRKDNQLLDLHPFVVCDLPQRPEQVLFLNESQDSQAKYVDYDKGGVIPAPQLLADHEELWKRLEQRKAETPPEEMSSSGDSPHVQSSSVPNLRVALLYKRHVQPDEQVLKWLETQLTANGYKVFIDRHLAIGVEWAREIAQQIQNSDAVIPLLSAASVQSEMLAYELKIAHEANQSQQGKPRLLPIRVNFTESLPEELATILDPVEYFLWEGPQDHQPVMKALLKALRHPAAHQSPPPESPGGAVPLESSFYVVRNTDLSFHTAIQQREFLVLIKGARQMGKTSLLARGLNQAEKMGFCVAFTDFQKLNGEQLTSADSFYRALGRMLARQLNIDRLPHQMWDAEQGPNANFEEYLKGVVLQQVTGPLVWGLDEVDRLFAYPYKDDVFSLFRGWHEDIRDPIWRRLTMIISYSTEAHLFISNIHQSPFNVGTRLELKDFTQEQMIELNTRYGSPLRANEVAHFHKLIGGQPYLARRGLHDLTTQGLSFAVLADKADRDEGPFGDHLRRLLMLVVKDSLLESVKEVLQGRPCTSELNFYRLRSAGVLAGESPREARFRSQLYKVYLERHMP